jgi:hypothetical protein
MRPRWGRVVYSGIFYKHAIPSGLVIIWHFVIPVDTKKLLAQNINKKE